MNKRVLFIDDDENQLKGYSLLLQKNYEVTTALSGPLALALLKEKEPFAVIVSDFQMPGMDGIEFLKQCHQRNPESVRMMLTGQANLADAVKAVNEGHIFQLILKPCPYDLLTKSLMAGLEQFRLMQVEKDLLDTTLKGIVKMLMEILAMENSTAFSRTTRVCRIMRRMGEHLEKGSSQELELAGLLSQIGCITLSRGTIERYFKGEQLSPLEQIHFFKHPQVAQHLLANIPRLEKIGLIIGFQFKNFDGSGSPEGKARGEDIPVGARVLRIAMDYDVRIQAGATEEQAILSLYQNAGVLYDPHLIAVLENELFGEHGPEMGTRTIALRDIRVGMVLGQTLFTRDQRTLLGRGQEITELFRLRLLSVGHQHDYLPTAKIVVNCPTNKVFDPVHPETA